MGDRSEIEWTDATWNPVTGCSKVSAGCKHCYAERIFPRLHGREFNAITGEPRRFTDVLEHPSRLDKPLRWRRARKVFVNSLSDLFHEDVSDDFLDHVFAVMALARWHTFQILTKRPERMLRYMSHPHRKRAIAHAVMAISNIRAKRAGSHAARIKMADFEAAFPQGDTGPFKNVWLGVSVENQETADERIPLLLRTPAAVRFLSCEPLLGPITLAGGRQRLDSWLKLGLHPREHGNEYDRGLDWVIVGGESGPDARMFRVQWARSIVRQCRAVGVPVFVKQMGSYVVDRNDAGFGEEDVPTAWPIRPDGCDPVIEYDIHGYRQHYQGADCRIRLMDRKGADPAEWPEDLRVREFPRAVGEEFRAALAGTVQPTEAS